MPSDDEIELSLNPYDDLSPNLASWLERFVLVEDYETSIGRVDVIRFMLQAWLDLDEGSHVEGDPLGSWGMAHKAGLFIAFDDRGALRECASPNDATAGISADSMEIVLREVVEQPEPRRNAVISAVTELVDEWGACLIDEEKLLGHLLVAHGAPASLVGTGHDELIAVHAKHHHEGHEQHGI